jgi:hypothetical protein
VCTRTEVSGDRGGTPPGTRTPNPLIIGLICSTLLVAVRNCYLTWAFAVRSWFVATPRFLTSPVESRPISRPTSRSCCVACPATVNGYVSRVLTSVAGGVRWRSWWVGSRAVSSALAVRVGGDGAGGPRQHRDPEIAVARERLIDTGGR